MPRYLWGLDGTLVRDAGKSLNPIILSSVQGTTVPYRQEDKVPDLRNAKRRVETQGRAYISLFSVL